jgi:hypothetical protein
MLFCFSDLLHNKKHLSLADSRGFGLGGPDGRAEDAGQLTTFLIELPCDNKLPSMTKTWGLMLTISDRQPFLLPGVSRLARRLPPGDEPPVSRVTKNSLFRILCHFVLLKRK